MIIKKKFDFLEPIRNILENILVVFVILKLTNLINWSWLWILSPIWVGFFIGLFKAILKRTIKGI
jgi:hypothetical protein